MIGHQPVMTQLRFSDDALLKHAETYVNDGWDALDVPDFLSAGRLAREALSLSPYSIDAYTIIAHTESVPAVRISLLQEGVRKGRRFVKPSLSGHRDVGFWQISAARSWFRAAQFLAIELWERGAEQDRIEAVGLLRELLRLDRQDDIGARFLAYGWFPAQGNWT